MNRLKPPALFSTIALAAALPVLSAAAEDRVALVIGNGEYQNVDSLPNPPHDAREVAKALRAGGYQVEEIVDGTVAEMGVALRKFAAVGRRAQAAVFFFAGHGFEVKDRNYLLPVDARLEMGGGLSGEALEAALDFALDRETLPLESVLAEMKKNVPALKLLVLDCCRDNPLPGPGVGRGPERERGLAQVSEDQLPEGTMLVFSGEPGQPVPDGTGRHSPFTEALLEQLRAKAGAPMLTVFTGVSTAVKSSQKPWVKFDGTGQSLAAFSSVALVPGDPFAGTRAGESKRNGLGMTLRWCPPGEFWMGSPESEAGRLENETRQKVELTRGFWLGQHEVTQGEWETVTGRSLRDQARRMLEDDTLHNIGGKQQTLRNLFGATRDADPATQIGNEAPDLPIYFVSWEESMEFCKRLTEQERQAGRLPEGWCYRLPSEAEWEYACRAGTGTALYTGALTIRGENNGPELDGIAWYGGNSSVGYEGRGWDTAFLLERQYPGGMAGPRSVGGKEPNAWGLHDMLGNVYEWCGDWYGDYPEVFVTDPRGASDGSFRVDRGGGWFSDAGSCRAASRYRSAPGYRYNILGFRVAVSSIR